MTTLAERIPVEEITAQAVRVRPGRVLLTLFAAVGFMIGWLPGRLWLGVAWFAVAVKVGWQAGAARGPARPDQ